MLKVIFKHECRVQQTGLLYQAVSSNNLDIVNYLLGSGVGTYSRRLIICAIHNGQLDILKTLVNHGAPVLAQNSSKKERQRELDFLHYAKKCNHRDIVLYLAELRRRPRN